MLRSPTVVLSLFEMFKRDGSLRFTSRRELLDRFELGDDATIILSGTQEDFLIERWWKLNDREGVTRGLSRLGIALITTPNYSVFGDVPRLDNLSI